MIIYRYNPIYKCFEWRDTSDTASIYQQIWTEVYVENDIVRMLYKDSMVSWYNTWMDPSRAIFDETNWERLLWQKLLTEEAD